jgi:hypothetical protein
MQSSNGYPYRRRIAYGEAGLRTGSPYDNDDEPIDDEDEYVQLLSPDCEFNQESDERMKDNGLR